MTCEDDSTIHRFRRPALGEGLTLALAVGIGGIAASAQAQSLLRVSGTLDLGVEYLNTGDPGANGSLRVSAGSGRASRIVFDGQEDLGRGLSAKFCLDVGILADTGANFPTGAGVRGPYGRTSVLGLASTDWGGVTIGRQNTPQFFTALKADVAANAYYGNTGNRSHYNNTRASNSVLYTSPTWSGLSVSGLWGAGFSPDYDGQERTTAPFDEGRQQAVSLDFVNDRLYLGYAYGRAAIKSVDVPTTTVHASDQILGAKYRFDAVTVNANWIRVSPPGSAGDIDVYVAGAMYRWATWNQLGAQVSRSRQRLTDGALSAENVISVHYSRDLSKRTMGYVNWARQANSPASSQPLIASIAPNALVPTTKGTTLNAWLVGMSHNF